MREPSEAGTIVRGNITYLPVIPGRIEFALRVRRYLLEHQPGVVALELPSSLEPEYRKALARLPQMSVILIPDDSTGQEEERATYIPIEPGDPFVEALRTAEEIGAQAIFLEASSSNEPHLTASYPDPYSLTFIGGERYLEAYRVHPQPRTPDIEAKAAACVCSTMRNSSTYIPIVWRR